MTKADRELVKELHEVIKDSAPASLDERQVNVVIPDSGYAEPISHDVFIAAARGIPNLYAVTRYHATRECPFDGWCIAFRRGAA